MKSFSLYIGMLLLLGVSGVPAAVASETPGVSALVQTAVVQQRRVVETLDAFGTIEPQPQHLMEIAAPRASVVQLLVPNGARVTRGEPLLSLTATPESSVLYAQAESQAVYARSALQHTQSLFKEHLATRDQLGAAEKALADARANLAAQQMMGGKGPVLLHAPADGVVTVEYVASGAQVAAGTTLLSIAEQGGVYARLGVEPGQIARVKNGTPVILSEVFNPHITRKTRISQVGGAVDPATGLVDVLVSVSGKHAGGFMPGTHVAGIIQVKAIRSLAVPRSAVLDDARGGYVFIVKNGTAHRVNVKTSADDGNWFAVQGDLHAGERVVTLGNYELTEGMAVREQTH